MKVSQAEVQAAQTNCNSTKPRRSEKQAQPSLQSGELDLTNRHSRRWMGRWCRATWTWARRWPHPFRRPIFLIAQDLTKMQVDTNVDESDVGPCRWAR